jgi:hypothetical protein
MTKNNTNNGKRKKSQTGTESNTLMELATHRARSAIQGWQYIHSRPHIPTTTIGCQLMSGAVNRGNSSRDLRGLLEGAVTAPF